MNPEEVAETSMVGLELVQEVAQIIFTSTFFGAFIK
jgi:hypothetical protein